MKYPSLKISVGHGDIEIINLKIGVKKVVKLPT